MAVVQAKILGTSKVVTLIESCEQGERRGHNVMDGKILRWCASEELKIILIAPNPFHKPIKIGVN